MLGRTQNITSIGVHYSGKLYYLNFKGSYMYNISAVLYKIQELNMSVFKCKKPLLRMVDFDAWVAIHSRPILQSTVPSCISCCRRKLKQQTKNQVKSMLGRLSKVTKEVYIIITITSSFFYIAGIFMAQELFFY